jgi:hypothetical protein
MNRKKTKEVSGQVDHEIALADELSEMIETVLMSWFEPPDFEVYRYTPICWRVRELKSASVVIAVVLEKQSEDTYYYTVGGDWPHRPTSKDTSRESLIEILNRLFPI